MRGDIPPDVVEKLSGAGSVTGDVLVAVTLNALPGIHILKLSTATPLSELVPSPGVKVMVKVAPAAIDKPLMVVDFGVETGVANTPDGLLRAADVSAAFATPLKVTLSPTVLPPPDRYCSDS